MEVRDLSLLQDVKAWPTLSHSQLVRYEQDPLASFFSNSLGKHCASHFQPAGYTKALLYFLWFPLSTHVRETLWCGLIQKKVLHKRSIKVLPHTVCLQTNGLLSDTGCRFSCISYGIIIAIWILSVIWPCAYPLSYRFDHTHVLLWKRSGVTRAEERPNYFLWLPPLRLLSLNDKLQFSARILWRVTDEL